MLKLRNLSLAIVSLALFSCCDKDDDVDTTPPQIQNLRINGQETDPGVTVSSATGMKLSAKFSDDHGLGSAKVNIHDDFDTHNHRISAVPFSFDTTFVLAGSMWEDTISINIPSDVVGGPYHMTVHLLDNSGNEALPYVVGFTIETGSEPEIAITSPDLTGDFHKGDTLFLDGTITDPDGIAEVQIIVEDHENEITIFNQDFDITTNITSWNIKEGIESTGMYIILQFPGDHAELRIIAKDNEGHLSEFEHEIHVH